MLRYDVQESRLADSTRPSHLAQRRIPEPALPSKDTWNVPFHVDAGILVQLGEELVTDRAVALAELVKNAYDADATRVQIRLDDVSEPEGAIEVSDNGSGMSPEAVLAHWMTIATPTKQKQLYSPKFKRLRAGSKGIGRFATRCLARKLTLTTVAAISSSTKRKTTAEFEWDRFKAGDPLDGIDVPVVSEVVSKSTPTGTTLLLSPLREVWTEKDVRSVRRHLNSLIDPRAALEEGKSDKDSFDFAIESPEYPSQSGSSAREFLDAAWCELMGQIDPDTGAAHYQLRILKGDHKGKTRKLTHPGGFPRLGSTSFNLRWIRYNKDAVAGLSFNIRDLSRVGRDHGGIAIYDKQFRVTGYGSPGDDWLQLDEDRANRKSTLEPHLRALAEADDRPLLLAPATTNVYGSVSLDGHAESDFRQTPNRERFVQNEAFEQLRSFVRSGIDWMTVIYAQLSYEERTAPRESPAAQIRQVRMRLERREEELGQELSTEISQVLRIAESTIEAQREETIGELSMLRVMASAGTMVQVFTHQLVGVLAGLESDQRSLTRFRSSLPESRRPDYSKAVSMLKERLEAARHQSELLGLLHGRDARKHRRRHNVRAVLDEVVGAFAGYAESFGITINTESEVPSTLKSPPVFRAELGAILLNVITNAIKAVKDTKQRDILVEAWRERDPDQVVIHVHDSGIGADESRWEDYFKPFVSDSKPDVLLGVGTGLGLKIVRDFLEPYDGEAAFVEPPDGWSTTMQIILPEP